jgi:hypothetical protein
MVGNSMATAWRFQTLVARNPDDSFPQNRQQWQTAQYPINFDGSKPNPLIGLLAVANLT